MVGYRPARGLYTLLTDPDLVGHNLLGNLCKGHVASLCNHTSVVWYGALQTPHGWVQSSSELLCCLWWKCTTSAEYNTNLLAVLTVKSGLDPHMIKLWNLNVKLLFYLYLWFLHSSNWVGMNLHSLVIMLLIKLDSLKCYSTWTLAIHHMALHVMLFSSC
jgi:hypothetical protein